jgi:hypothetical protein
MTKSKPNSNSTTSELATYRHNEIEIFAEQLANAKLMQETAKLALKHKQPNLLHAEIADRTGSMLDDIELSLNENFKEFVFGNDPDMMLYRDIFSHIESRRSFIEEICVKTLIKLRDIISEQKSEVGQYADA